MILHRVIEGLSKNSSHRLQHTLRVAFTDPDTSKEAAAPVNSAALEALVMDALRANSDSSIQEIVCIMGERYCSVSPRFAPLRRKGLIYVSGKKKAPQTGRKVLRWRAA